MHIRPMLEFFYIALSGALLSYMYAVCLEDGMIFERLGRWLETGQKYKKMLGGCVYCTTPYITGLMYLLYIYANQAWIFVFIIVIAFFIIGLIDRHGML